VADESDRMLTAAAVHYFNILNGICLNCLKKTMKTLKIAEISNRHFLNTNLQTGVLIILDLKQSKEAGAFFTPSGFNAVWTFKYLPAFKKFVVLECLALKIQSLSSCKKPVSNYRA
jgi:hypothetical protein